MLDLWSGILHEFPIMKCLSSSQYMLYLICTCKTAGQTQGKGKSRGRGGLRRIQGCSLVTHGWDQEIQGRDETKHG